MRVKQSPFVVSALLSALTADAQLTELPAGVPTIPGVDPTTVDLQFNETIAGGRVRFPRPTVNSWDTQPLYRETLTGGRRFGRENTCSTTCIAEINEDNFEDQYSQDAAFGRTFCAVGSELDYEKRNDYIEATNFAACESLCCKPKTYEEPQIISCLYHGIQTSMGEPVCADPALVLNTDADFQKYTMCNQDPLTPKDADFKYCGDVCCQEPETKCDNEGQDYAGNLMCVYYSLAHIDGVRTCKEANVFAFERTKVSCHMPVSSYTSYSYYTSNYELECTSDDGQSQFDLESNRLSLAQEVFCDTDGLSQPYCPYSTAVTPASIAIDRMCAAYEQYQSYVGLVTDQMTCDYANVYVQNVALSDTSLPTSLNTEEGQKEYLDTVAQEIEKVKDNGCLYPYKTGFVCPYFCGYSSLGDCKF